MNIDRETVDAFGKEWSSFDQSKLSTNELQEQFDKYFKVFPWDDLPSDPVGFDLGCGSGRWAKLVAPRVGKLHCIDPSKEALEVAQRNLRSVPGCEFHLADAHHVPLPNQSMDFGYSLGVLHHIPDTRAALAACVQKLKPRGLFLVYLYYAFDNRPAWFRMLWRVSDLFRRLLSRLPHGVKVGVTSVIAAAVYWPLSRFALLLEKRGHQVETFPLSIYRQRSFYSMRTDALDRFGTRLEQRFTAEEIEEMMRAAGLEDIRFSDSAPYWCAVGRRTRFS